MARKPEQLLNDRLMPALFGLDPVRVENAVGPGTPDINYTGGWIEAKRVLQWPKRDDTPIRVPHYTPGQRGWHIRRRAAGGTVFVVIEVSTHVMVFDAADAAEGLGTWNAKEMFHHAKLVMCPFDSHRFRRFIDTYRK